MKSLVGLRFIIVLLYITCSACFDEDPVRPQPGPDGIVLNARTYTYADLPGTAKTEATDGYDSFNYSNLKDKTLKKEDGFYVALTLDNIKLAQASTNDTAWNKLIDPTSNYALYGKYRNRPEFCNAQGEKIKGLEKHTVHTLFYIARNGNTDTAYYGPMNERPAKVILNCSYLDSAHTPVMKVE